jgi:hypothetical protein
MKDEKQDYDFFKCIYSPKAPGKILWKRCELLEEINKYYDEIEPLISFSLCTEGSSQGISNKDLSIQEYIKEYEEFIIFIEMIFTKLHSLDIVFRTHLKNPDIWKQKTCWPSRNNKYFMMDSCLNSFIRNIFFPNYPKLLTEEMKTGRIHRSKIIQNKKKCLNTIARNLEKIINK